MLDTKLERLFEHERACSNLIAGDRKQLRQEYKGEHSYDIPATQGKLGESMTPRQSYIIDVMQKKIDNLTLELLGEKVKKEEALDDSYKHLRELKALRIEKKTLIEKLKLERSTNASAENRINVLLDKIRSYTG